MSHERDLADQDIEELAEEIWTLGEEGQDGVDELRARSAVAALDSALLRLIRSELALVEDGRVLLTAAGRQLAERQVRRHRLAEVLFTTVLDVPDDAAVNRTACVIEHVLDLAMTDSVCAFLGHPRACPHGKPIPSGECCRSFSQTVTPLVQPLPALAPGQSGRIVHIVAREPQRLARLSGLGVVPGAVVSLQQKGAAIVLKVGETTLAVDREVAGEIYVKRTG